MKGIQLTLVRLGAFAAFVVSSTSGNGELVPVIWGKRMQLDSTAFLDGSFKDVALGKRHGLALSVDGEVHSWGVNNSGVSAHHAAFVPEEVTDVVSFAAGKGFSAVLQSDGKAVIWGWTLETGDMKHVESGVVRVSASDSHVVMLTEDRRIRTKGLSSGRVPDEAKDGMVVDVVAGTKLNLALKEDGSAVVWGAIRSLPEQFTDLKAVDVGGGTLCIGLKKDGTVVTNGPMPGDGLNGVTAIAAGIDFALALKEDGTVTSWGSSLGEVPNDLAGVVSIHADPASHVAVAIREDGSAVAWNYRPKPSSLAVDPYIRDVSTVTAAFFGVTGFRSDGGIYGFGAEGEDHDTPLFQTQLESVRVIKGNQGTVVALLRDGLTVRTIGNLASGTSYGVKDAEVPGAINVFPTGHLRFFQFEDGSIIGDGRSFDVGSPVTDVPEDLGRVVQVAGNSDYVLALQDDGAVRGWGNPRNGNLEVPEFPLKVLSVAVGGKGNLALLEDGTVEAWGDKGRASARLPHLTHVIEVAVGTDESLALRSDGTVISWGSDTPIPETILNWGNNGSRVGRVKAIAASGSAFSAALVEMRMPGDADTDGDGMTDAYEEENGLKITVDDAGSDLDDDGLTNLEEFRGFLKANSTDSDSDGLPDNVETDTGVWVNASDTGTSPRYLDTDRDGIPDGAETMTGVFVSLNDTGSHPLEADTDGDHAGDGLELRRNTNPVDPSDFPTVIDSNGYWDIEVVYTDETDLTEENAQAVLASDAERITARYPYVHFHSNTVRSWHSQASSGFPVSDTDRRAPPNFVLRATGQIRVAEANGFYVISADRADGGVSLKFDGSSRNRFFPPPFGQTRTTADRLRLALGIHDVEFVYWNNSTRPFVNLSIYRGTSLNGAFFEPLEYDFELLRPYEESPQLTEIELWRERFFNTPDALGVSEDDADPDKDQKSNLMEFVIGRDPLTPDESIELTIERDAAKAAFTRAPAAESLFRLFVEWSDDLAPARWQPVTDGETVVRGPDGLDRVEVNLPLGKTTGYVRLRAMRKQ